MDERQINPFDKLRASHIKALRAAAGIVMIPQWIAEAAARHDPHLQLGVANSVEMTLGDIAVLGEN